MEEQIHSDQFSPKGPNPDAIPENLPNSRIVLLLGILSIVFCWWHFVSVIGIILGIITLVLAQKETTLFEKNPGRYTLTSFNNVKIGRICAIIGLIISVVVFIFVMLFIFGLLVTLPFWGMIN